MRQHDSFSFASVNLPHGLRSQHGAAVRPLGARCAMLPLQGRSTATASPSCRTCILSRSTQWCPIPASPIMCAARLDRPL